MTQSLHLLFFYRQSPQIGIEKKRMKTQDKAYSWMRSLLTGWGLSECWAKLIAGMIVGALAAVGILNSCTITYKQNAAGDREFHSVIVQPSESESCK